jgi:hypothetical protein
MSRINKARVLLGGLLAGIVINVVEGIMHGVVLADQDAAMMSRLNLSPGASAGRIAALNAWGFALGILTVFTYAAIRPRFGAGPGTAVRAGLLMWASACVLGAAIPGILGIYKLDLTLINAGYELVMLPLAAVAGAAVYKEGSK